MKGLLPPSSRGARERDLLHVRMLHQDLARGSVAGDDVEHARRQPSLRGDPGKAQRRERRELGGLQDDGVSRGERRRDFPGDHQEREVPRDDLPHDTDRHVARELRVAQLRPAGVMIEVPGDERDVEVAGFANRFAVVQTLEHREQARVALHLARQRVQVTGAGVRRQRRPAGRRGVGGGDRGVHVRRTPLGDARQHRLRRRIDRLEILPGSGLDPAAVDEMAEAAVRHEQLGNGGHFIPSGDGARRRSARSRSARAAVRCPSARRWHPA